MNFRRTNYKFKIIKNANNYLKYSTQHLINLRPKRLIKNISCRNFFTSSTKNSLFSKTVDQFNFDSIKLKNSLSSLFQGNDVDLVHNLNFDNMGQINDNKILRENLINSLKGNVEENGEEKKEDLFEKNKDKKEKVKEITKLPEINKIKMLNEYKSYELIQSHNKKIKNEISAKLEKELINKLKNIRLTMNNKKEEKNEIFKNIKKVQKELEEIDLENYFSKEKYKKQIDDIVKKTIPDNEEIMKNKVQAKIRAKNRKLTGNFMEVYNSRKSVVPNNFNANSNNANNTPSKSPQNNNKNESEKKSIENNLDRKLSSNNLINNLDNNNDKGLRKNMSKKSLEIFKMNILQTQRKKEFENFQYSQKEKVLKLKVDLKNMENELIRIDKFLENNKKQEKEIVNKLMLFYKELLFKGKSVKNDGLVWIIKTIWYLGENVPLSFMPQFLDFESIDYLFQLAHKQLEIEYCSKKIREMKLNVKKEISVKYKEDIKKLNISNKIENAENDNYSYLDKKKIYLKIEKKNQKLVNKNKKDVYRNLVKEFDEKKLPFEIMDLPEINRINKIKKHIEKIKNEIVQLKKNEVKRITKCFIENDYEEKYHVNIETVLAALIGEDAKDTEMNKYNLNKKNYITKLKKIRFFDHDHIKKISPN